MAHSGLSVPSISISLAPADDPPVEPFSPFYLETPSPATQEDSYRPSLLSPPPVISPRFPRQPSPLRPADTLLAGKGLDRGQFEALLASSRERNAGARKEPNLRKELAMKAHKSKQIERRALFLSKINAPPSPTATSLPKTPPESPAIFHYSLPSPGLDSPLALFESLQQKEKQKGSSGPIQYPAVQPWVERVQYRQLDSAGVRPPSLEQITAHLSSHGNPTAARDKDDYLRPPLPLPTFLLSPSHAKVARTALHHAEKTDGQQIAESETRAPIPGTEEFHTPLPEAHVLPTASQLSLQVTATIIPRPSKSSLTELTEVNLRALNSRTLTGRDMMSKLKRRTSGIPSADDMEGRGADDDERRARRISAPAELPKRERSGFIHPILALPGAF